MKPISTRERSRARRAIVQALYQWQITGQDPAEIAAQFVDDQQLAKCDSDYFHQLFIDIPTQIVELDQALEPLLDRPMTQVDPVEKAILRLGVFELIYRLDIPVKVTLNEAVELAKAFGAEQSHKYVNGILDHIAHHTRSVECSKARP